MDKVLIVEDDLDINNLLYNILNQNNFQVTSAYSGSEAKMCLDQFAYDIILLDLMLPGITGEELITIIRDKSFVPIIAISAKTSAEDKINVLKLGADDFIGKPFDIEEVLARVQAQIRRYKSFSVSKIDNNKLVHKNLTLDMDSRQVFISNEEIILTAREFEIVQLFMKNPHKVFTRANIFESVWKDEFMGDDNTVNVHVSNIRSKIDKKDKENEYIQTVWGIGFKLKE